jgi:hypothetical protein
MADRLGTNMANVSKSLSFLRRLGIVRDRKVGVTTYFTFAMPELGAFFGCVEGHVASRMVDRPAIYQRPEDSPDPAMVKHS